ncbi:putative flavin-containing polyamine oxidase [Truncatella angustata]|uniref:Amine oxidase n=1 Tax=Truncatella angustata TaxID=152316 RepID=A0A9P8UT64_9PEZI|nr:putative flavin-containing polyamine oxidase [Truncatella angustata]KAH6657570.1 putative flavin-containing polyamine oxidase [Truncatella angustata]
MVGSNASVIQQRRNATSCYKTQVAILGAGVAGVTAAHALANASITDFIIVERNDYIGGRVAHTSFGRTDDSSSYTVELGANWIQGLGSPDGPENPIWSLGKKYHLDNTYSDYSSILTYDETGYMDYADLLDEWDTIYDIAEDDAGTILTENRQDYSARTGLGLAGWKPKKDMHAQAVEWWSWDWETSYVPEQSSFEFGVAGNNLTFNQFSDENNFVWDQRGFNSFVIGEASEFLAENDSRILLETTVTGITYSQRGVTVSLGDEGCIEAEHAVCTFSLGVLQNEVVDFKPALPRWKREAIESFQMGTYTKIFLQFNETFWDPDTQFFLYADPDTRGYYPVWQSLSTPGFLEGSNIIFATVVGDESYRIEQQSDEETLAECIAVLQAMFPDIDIPEPIAIKYPRWSQEEWAFGSYSNWPVGTTLERHQNLRANIDRLWFAGEANSAEYFGFLHGAYYEGREVGERVAAALVKNETCASNSTGSYNMARYEVLYGTTNLSEFNVQNGWPVSSFLDYDVDDNNE